MSILAFNVSNPGFYIAGIPTSQEAAVLTNLTGLAYVTGDILYYDGVNLNRLPIGSVSEVLTVVSGLPSWEVPTGGGVTDHGALTGLADDDHTQYHTDARGDARYYTQTQLNAGQLDTRYYTETETNTLLSGKANTSHAHIIADVTGLQTALDGKASALGTDDNYVTDAEKAALHPAVTLDGTPNYLTIVGQTITRALINLASHVTGRLPFANLTTLSAHQVLGRAGSGTGDVAGITMGNDTILGRAGSGDVDDLSASQVRTILNVADGATANSTDVTLLARANHTGEQAISTITGLQTALDSKASSSHTHTLSTGATDVTATAAELNILDGATLTVTELNYVDGVTSAIQTQLNAKASTTAPTLTGTTTVDRLDYDRAVGGVNAIGNLGATETIDWSTHTHFTGNLDSNITFTYSNQVSGQTITLYLTYSGAQRTITWPTTTWMDNASGAAPTAPAASGKVLVVTLVYIGTTVYGSATGNYAVY